MEMIAVMVKRNQFAIEKQNIFAMKQYDVKQQNIKKKTKQNFPAMT